MTEPPAAHPSAEGVPSADLDAAQLRALAAVPSGAATLAGVAIFLLLIAWVLIYALIYLPRGMIG